MPSLIFKLILLVVLANPANHKPIYPKPTMFTVPIMTYHHIESHRGIYYVAPARFEQQLAYLVAHDYHTVSMDTYANYLEIEETFQSSPLIVSFYDAYADSYITRYTPFPPPDL